MRETNYLFEHGARRPTMSPTPSLSELSLFPLQAVLFPDGLLSLKVFEARYLDLVGSCLRESQPFGVVALRQGTEQTNANAVPRPSANSIGTPL